jgi:hypothetical protein
MPPGNPTNIEAISKDSSAILTWTSPVNVGSGIIGYSGRANPLDGGTAVLWFVTDPSKRQSEVQGLSPNKLYNFSITANDSSGAGPASLSNTVKTGAQIYSAVIQNAERSSGDVTDFKASKTTLKYQDQSIPQNPAYTPFRSHTEYIRYLKAKATVSRA